MKRTIPVATLVVGLLLLGLAGPGPARAVTIAFEATDLADPIAGQDLWRYTYVVSDLDARVNLAFEVLFDPALYGVLQDPPPFVNADWDVLALQPDPGLPDAGRYSALALVDGASLADAFSLSFAWLGVAGTTPGAQPFEVVEFDGAGNFIDVLESGVTVRAAQAVPLPDTLALMTTGLLAFVVSARRWGRRA